jgi:uncharacterized membrane protein
MPINIFNNFDDPLATFSTRASGINGMDQIVGGYTDANSKNHGFLLSGGTYTTLDDPLASAGGTGAIGINASGQIVGEYGNATGNHGFLLSGGIYTTLDAPGAIGPDGTIASGINTAGQIVGLTAATPASMASC